MSKIALIDTNVVSYLFRRDTRASRYVPILLPFESCLISFQTAAELEFWTLKHNWGTKRRADLAYFLEAYDVIYPDESVCKLWASVRKGQESKGTPIHPEDAWIAATALAVGCPLVTHNVNDFRGIDGLDVLTCPPG
jgi:tRNA(fMet)-specific endonuclease VapC